MSKRRKYRQFGGRAALAGWTMLALLAACSQDEAQEQFTATPISFKAGGLRNNANIEIKSGDISATGGNYGNT